MGTRRLRRAGRRQLLAVAGVDGEEVVPQHLQPASLAVGPRPFVERRDVLIQAHHHGWKQLVLAFRNDRIDAVLPVEVGQVLVEAGQAVDQGLSSWRESRPAPGSPSRDAPDAMAA